MTVESILSENQEANEITKPNQLTSIEFSIVVKEILDFWLQQLRYKYSMPQLYKILGPRLIKKKLVNLTLTNLESAYKYVMKYKKVNKEPTEQKDNLYKSSKPNVLGTENRKLVMDFFITNFSEFKCIDLDRIQLTKKATDHFEKENANFNITVKNVETIWKLVKAQMGKVVTVYDTLGMDLKDKNKVYNALLRCMNRVSEDKLLLKEDLVIIQQHTFYDEE